MEYKVITDEQRASMLRQRIQALEVDHFGHQMNLDGLAVQPEGEQRNKAVEFAQNSQATIEAAHSVAVAELDAVEARMEQESQER